MDAPVNEEYGVDVTAPSNVSTSLGTAVANFIRQYVVVSISVLLIATVISIFALINDPPTGVAPLQAVVMPIGFSGLILICVLGILLLSWIIAWILGRRYRRFMDLATVPFSFLSTRKPQNPFERILSERNLQPDEVVLAQKMTVLSEIDERVASLRRRTTTILTTMGLSLLGAALVAIFAGRLTSLDAAAVSNIDKLKSEKSEQMRYLANISQFQKNYVRLENARKEPDTDIGRSERELTNFVERVFARGEIPPNDLTSAEELKRTVENQFASRCMEKGA